jgi:hypothetical protein
VSGAPWSPRDVLRLRGLWEGGADPDDIAALLGRPVNAVKEKAKTEKYRRPAWYLAWVRAEAARRKHGQVAAP